MRALITGATGFVGPHLSRHLQDCGDEVIETDRTTGLDIADLDGLTEHFRRQPLDVIYHLAGDADVGGSWNHPLSTFRANAEGTMNVLEAARAASVERVIAISSADVYGTVRQEELPLTESSELRPTSPYALSKVSSEFACIQAKLGYGQSIIRVRAFNHLGPGQSTRFVAPAIAWRIAENEQSGNNAIQVGNLTPARDFTDVRDVVRAYRALAVDGIGGEVYNVCSGQAHTISDLVNQLIALSTVPMTLDVDPELQRAVDIPVLIGSPAKLQAATGWTPEIPLHETLSNLMDDMRSRRSTADPSGG
jgi:GDP-4-dehydro-6-deoxy-D-mannose reductase